MSKLSVAYLKFMQEFSEEGQFLNSSEHADWLNCYQKNECSTLKQNLLIYRPHIIENLHKFIEKCALQKISVKVRAGGTSLNTSFICFEGVILLMGHFKKILNYDPIYGRIVIEPGVTVTQLNQFISEDKWEFPLEMQSNGVATLAGSLSSNSKDYLQTSTLIYENILSVTIINGCGKIQNVPAELFCGTEGRLGIIIQLEIQLSHKKEHAKTYSIEESFENIDSHWPFLKKYHSLKNIYWQNDKIVFEIEGERWRSRSTIDELNKIFNPKFLNEVSQSDFFQEQFNHLSCYISSALSKDELMPAQKKLEKLSAEMNFVWQIRIDCVNLHVQAVLAYSGNLKDFQIQLEKFKVEWLNYLKQKKGKLMVLQGIGQLWHIFHSQALQKNEVNLIEKLQEFFDPHQIFRHA